MKSTEACLQSIALKQVQDGYNALRTGEGTLIEPSARFCDADRCTKVYDTSKKLSQFGFGTCARDLNADISSEPHYEITDRFTPTPLGAVVVALANSDTDRIYQ